MKSLRDFITESAIDISTIGGMEQLIQSKQDELVDLGDPKDEYGDITQETDTTDDALTYRFKSLDDIWGYLKVDRPTTTDYYFVINSSADMFRFTYKNSTSKLQSTARWEYDSSSDEIESMKENTQKVVKYFQDALD